LGGACIFVIDKHVHSNTTIWERVSSCLYIKRCRWSLPWIWPRAPIMRPSSIIKNLPLVVFVDPAWDILIIPAPQVALTTMVLVSWLHCLVSIVIVSIDELCYLPNQSW
jgi:hypothetical protein